VSWAHNGDCEIWYETFGDATNPALLMVNGLGSQSINYQDAWCEMFAAEGLFVIRYDNRDVGLSSSFAGAPVGELGNAYVVSDMAADGMAVLDALGIERAHVMGLSMGGMIVQTMAIEHPDRLLSMTSVMSSTGEPEFGQSTPRAFELLTGRPPPTARATSRVGSTGCASGAAPSSSTRTDCAPTPSARSSARSAPTAAAASSWRSARRPRVVPPSCATCASRRSSCTAVPTPSSRRAAVSARQR
jgi:pimeloyl-ACP methyl ester carboxylesterase